jgi:uncharacterized protein (TIGR04255 family)
VKSHDPWRAPPLQEAVFEIRFPTLADYALFAGGMAGFQKGTFPNAEKLPAADLPGMIDIPGMVRHRFASKDGVLLFQTGPNVLSVNAIAYQGFDNFLKQIESILESAGKLIDLSQSNRIGLRYINQFVDVNDPSATLRINQPFQNTDLTKTKFLQLREVKETTDAEVFLGITIQFPTEPNNLILDLDSFCDIDQKEWDIPMMLDWISRGHEMIWKDFLALVSTTEQEARR